MEVSRMKLSEIIAEIGDENVSLQVLDLCTVSIKDEGAVKHVTFGTTEEITPDSTSAVGLIVWVPRDKLNTILLRERAKEMEKQSDE